MSCEKTQIAGNQLGVKDTISMATGFAIGSGVITMTGVAIGMTGRSVIISYLMTAITFLLACLPTIMLSSIYAKRSASYVYSSELLHPKIGGLYSYVYFLGRFTISVFGISFAQYLSALIPNLNQQLTAIAVLTLFYVINLFGNKAAAKAQNLMFYILVISLGVFIIAGLTKVDLVAYFNMDNFFLNGFDGLWSAASLLVFAVGGAGVLVDYGDQVANPQKVIPKVVIGVTIVVSVAYALLSLVAAGVLPYEQVAYQPMTNSAGAVFGTNSIMYALFICGGALLALATTLNSSFSWYSNALIRSCENGWFPKSWAKTNRHGAPHILLTIFYLFGLIPTLSGLDITVLSKMAVAMTTMMWMIPTFALARAPKVIPEVWNKSSFAKLPQWSLWIMCGLSFVIYGSQTWSLLKDNPPLSNWIIGIYMVCVVVYLIFKKDCPGSKAGE